MSKRLNCGSRNTGKNDSLYNSLMSNQNLSGFHQLNYLINDSIGVLLFDEGGVRLSRHICLKHIMFSDATGGVLEQLKGLQKDS